MQPSALDAIHYFLSEENHIRFIQDELIVIAWALGFSSISIALISFRKVWPERQRSAVSWLLGAVGILGFVATYQWIDQSYIPSSWSASTIEGGLTALFAVGAVIFVSIARRFHSLNYISVFLAGLAGWRIVLLHLADSGASGESFFLNALLLQFGFPFMATCYLAWSSGLQGEEKMRRIFQLSAMLLGFVWATFLVQDYFGGSELLGGATSNSELYTYSVVWLALAVAYQAIGLWRNQAVIHVGSLVLLLLTISKVFLIDASELEGLFRVLSFLGLGFTLIGIGFFYNKVVFARRGSVSTGISQSTEK